MKNYELNPDGNDELILFPPELTPGLPDVEDPAVPNRAWTEMKLGKDIDELTEEEKRDLYLGHDSYF